LSGKYRVTARLGEGGMGHVYLAQQEPLDRTVAVKVLAGDKARAEEGRFLREAKLLSRLSHPNIVSLHDYGTTEDGDPYLVMERIEGADLRATLVQRGALPCAEVVVILRQVVAAIAEAHRQGVAHLDLKPENIMLATGPDGQAKVKVLDFGIARMTAPEKADATATDTGKVLGTPAYISPEQIRGVRDDVRSDLYALGMVAYEMFSGQLPFEARTTAELVLHHMSTEPQPLSDKQPDVPASLAAWVHRMLAKEASDRPADGAQAARLLEAAAGGNETEMATGPIVTPAPNIAVPPARDASPAKSPWPLRAAAAATLALIAVAAFALSTRQPAPEGPQRLVVLSFHESSAGVPAGFGEVLANAVGHGLVGTKNATLVSPLLARAAAHDEGLASFAETADAAKARGVLDRLGATLAVTADVVAAGDQLRAQLTLTSLSDGSIVASVADTTPLQKPQIPTLARALSAQLKQNLDGGDAGPTKDRIPITSFAASSAYLRGLDELNVRADYEKAAAHFRHALELDSEFALAWSELACALSFIGTEEANRELETAAARVAALKHKLPEPDRLLAEGNVLWSKDADAALAKYSEYARRYPDDRVAHFYLGMGRWYLQKDVPAATASLLRARELTPTYLPVTRELVWMASANKDFEQALAWSEEYTKAAPTDARGWVLYADQLAQAKRIDDAKRALTEALRRDSHVNGVAAVQEKLKG
jgi:serine/threonine-protein kinase